MTETSSCNELNSLKYKTMILNGISWPEVKSTGDLVSLDKFLESEKNINACEPWSKLDKTAKIKKLLIFAENYKNNNSLNDDEYEKLIIFLKECLDRKKLQRVKDVSYDKETGLVKDLPALSYNKVTNNFTLKNIDKRVSTLRGLAPKKKQGTAKNIQNNDCDSEEEN
jgi:hypothetical protein